MDATYMYFLILIIFYAIFSVISAVICSIFTFKVASNKGYYSFWWIILGLFLGVVGLLVVIGLPDKKVQDTVNKLFEDNLLLHRQLIDFMEKFHE